MSVHAEETVFFSFICPSCQQEIEAPAGMANLETECPSCAAPIRVPVTSEPGKAQERTAAKDRMASQAQIEAMKSRTIRIELSNNW